LIWTWYFHRLLAHCVFGYSGYQISNILLGERTVDFDGEGVLQTAQKKLILVIFVGTLVKPLEG
jgi:hypothetical protein